jgi:drug/metabolite transporter (DMT)-like permease
LLGAALLFSTGGAAIKATTLTGWQVASFRSGVAAIALLLFLPAARRNWTRRPWLVAVAYAGTLVFFVLANKLTTSANAIFLQSAAPLYLAILSPLVLRESVRRDEWWLMGAIAVGLFVCFRADSVAVATAPDPVRGNVLAVGSGVCYALMVLGLRWISTHETDRGLAAVTIGNLLACLTVLPMALPVAQVGARDVLVILYLGVFQIGLAYVLVSRALRIVPALEASLLLLVEPVLNPVWAWLVHGERPGLAALGGGLIILAATLVLALRGARAVASGPASEPAA